MFIKFFKVCIVDKEHFANRYGKPYAPDPGFGNLKISRRQNILDASNDLFSIFYLLSLRRPYASVFISFAGIFNYRLTNIKVPETGTRASG